MAATTSLLQTLHRMNRQKADLEGQLKRGPKVIAAAQARLDEAEKGAQDIRDEMTQMRLDADSKQLQMKEREDKIHQWQGQMNAAKDNREYQTLKDQIAADTQANVVLSDEILEILENLDGMEDPLSDAEANVAEVRSEFEKIEAQILDKRKNLESELQRVGEELSEAEKELTGDLRRDYQRLVEARGEEALAPARGWVLQWLLPKPYTPNAGIAQHRQAHHLLQLRMFTVFAVVIGLSKFNFVEAIRPNRAAAPTLIAAR